MIVILIVFILIIAGVVFHITEEENLFKEKNMNNDEELDTSTRGSPFLTGMQETKITTTSKRTHAVISTALIKQHFLLGDLHRDDGPAVERIVDGKLIEQEWWKNGLRHREDGPAHILYGTTDSYSCIEPSSSYWINGSECTKEELALYLEKKRLHEKLQSSLLPKPTTQRGKI